jgi:hypothetical protein
VTAFEIGKQVLVGRHPLPQPADARLLIDPGLPAQEALGLADVADVARLVARAPFAAANPRLHALQVRQQLAELLPDGEGVAWPPADIEYLPGGHVDLLDRQSEGAHQVVHEEDVAHLLAVAVDCDRVPGEGRDHEVG